jgi:hypothetical protein
LVVDLDQGEDDRPAKFPHRPLEGWLPQNEEKRMSPQSSSICHGALMATTLGTISAMKTSLGMGLNDQSPPCKETGSSHRGLVQSGHIPTRWCNFSPHLKRMHVYPRAGFGLLSQAGRPYVAYLAHDSRSGRFTDFYLLLLDNSIRCSTVKTTEGMCAMSFEKARMEQSPRAHSG